MPISTSATARSTVRYRLRRPRPIGPPIVPTAEQAAVIGHRRGRLKVLAGPGTGKTATLVEAVADRLELGVAPRSMLVLTFSRRAAAEISDRLARRVGVTTREPMVRTLHSFAWSVLRASAVGQPPPRLLGAGESDRMVRELLAGHAEAGGAGWPEILRPALTSPAFAGELRDLLLRAAERGITAQQISRLGRERGRPEWVAAGRFATEYHQVSDLRQGSSGFGAALDQAELTAAAVAALAPGWPAGVHRLQRLFVDEYQDVDPAQAALIDLVAADADELVVVGDPDQSIYRFRGADAGAMSRVVVDDTVALTLSRRSGAGLLSATRRVADLLPAAPGSPAHRRLTAAPGTPPGEVDVRVLPTAAREAAYLADRLRRAHLLDGVPWARMAVLVRSPQVSLPALARAFAVAGIPLTTTGGRCPPLSDPVAACLVRVLESALEPGSVTGERALELLASPVGGMDAVAIRRLRRSVRAARPEGGSSADQLAAMVLGAPLPSGLPAELLRPVRSLAAVLGVARDQVAAPDAESVLWDVWQRTGLSADLVLASERGGTAGQRADAALDAVMELFAAAADLAASIPGAGLRAFVSQATGQLVAADRSGPAGGAVRVMSAHAAKGAEWDVVAVAGVQEGSWPDLRPRGSLLATDELLDRVRRGQGRPVEGAELLADERRLFYVACTRARATLIVTAVQAQDRAPSRFLLELAGSEAAVGGWPQTDTGRDRRSLHLADLIADLRRNLVDPGVPPATAAAAAAQLARLAVAGVPGAHPESWYGLAGPSTTGPAISPGQVVSVSPSAVEAVSTCALRAVLERRGGRRPVGDAQTLGILVHAAATGLGQGLTQAQVSAEIETYLDGQDQLPGWQRDRTRRAVQAMTAAVADWIEQHRSNRRYLGSELLMDIALPDAALPEAASDDAASDDSALHEDAATSGSARPGAAPDSALGSGAGPAAGSGAGPGGPPIRLTGRVDWLATRVDGGAAVVTDFKTGVSLPTKNEVAHHIQLATYQLGVALGAFDELAPGLLPGGAELVGLRTGKPRPRHQDPLDADGRAERIEAVRATALHLTSPTATAGENKYCETCPVRTCCPLQPEGRQVTR